MASYKVVFLVLTFIASCCLDMVAQEKVSVGSPVYDTMLNTLLSRDVPEISAKQLATDIDKVLLLDTREKEEYDVSHIPGALYAGYDNFSIDQLGGLNKEDKIIVYCSVGYRSEKITQRLLSEGFTNVSNLYGGLFEWKNIDQEVVDLLGNKTNAVHAYDRTWGIWLQKGKKVY